MKHILFAFGILFISTFQVHAQPLKIDACELPDNLIPDTLGYTPIKRVRLVLHIFAKADSSGNFRDRREDRDFIQMILNHMQWFYNETEPLRNAAPKYYHIVDSRIRFKVDTILFHYDDDAWNFKKYVAYYERQSGDSTGYNLSAVRNRCEQLYKKFVKENAALTPKLRDSALHIFFLEASLHPDKGMAENYNSKRWAYFNGGYYHFMKDKAHWGPGQLMAHEIGHSLGLIHPFDYSGCDDLPLSEKGSTNDFMDVYPMAGRAMTPCQMGQIHRNLLGGGMGNIDHTLIKDWCYYHPDETMTIKAGDTVYWDGPHNLWGDLVIESGAALVARCEVSMPPGAEIRIKNNGALIVDGGVITQKCGASWKGIKLQSRKKWLGLFNRKSQAKLEVKNGGRIEKNKEEASQAEF